MKRCFNETDAVETAIGFQPRPEDINLEGTDVSLETLQELLKVDTDLWKQEVDGIKEFYARFGEKLPSELVRQLGILEENLA